MGFHSVERVKSRLDEVLKKEELDADAVDALCDALTPNAAGTWPGVEVVLHVVERTEVAEALRDGSAPERLMQVVSEAIRAVAPLVERSPQYPLNIQAERLRRAFDREAKKYELVRRKMKQCTEDRAKKIAGAYLETSPAPLFAEKLAAEFKEIFAGALVSREAGRRAIASDERLVQLLKFETPVQGETVQEMMQRLDEMARQIDDLSAAVRWAVSHGEPEEALVGAALAARRGLSHVSSALLSHVVQAKPFAAQAAAFAAWLTPSTTRHVLARFLVDVLNDSTPRQEYGIDDDALRRSIVAARTVLPRIGSPVDEIAPVDEEAEEVAQTTLRAFEFCGASRV